MQMYVNVTSLLLSMLLTLTSSLNNRWCPWQCQCYNGYTTADCSNRQIVTIPRVSPLTTWLYLDTNTIWEIQQESFSNLSNIMLIALEYNKIEIVSSRAFCGLKSLEKLNLAYNDILQFNIDDYCPPNTMLRQIQLNGNRLQGVPNNMSMFCPNLHTINLSYNDIRSVTFDNSFTTMTSLVYLDLSGNSIFQITESDFSKLNNVPIQVLKISETGLWHIEPGAFQGLKNLTELSISKNVIDIANLQVAFRQLSNNTNLVSLDLSVMYIPNITVSMVTNFESLTSFDVSFTDVERIEPRVFDVLPYLETLRLDSNRLTTVDNVNSLLSLRWLRLQHNMLHNVNLSCLDNLETADVSYNKMTILGNNWLYGTQTIQSLNLSHNYIQYIHGNAFTGVHLHKLDLSHNKLSLLGNMGFTYLANIYLTHNAVTRVTNDAFANIQQNLEEINLSYNNLTSVDGADNCDFISLQRLNLGYNKLGTNPDFEFFRSLSHVQVLDLSHNGISNFPLDKVGYLHHVTTLYLQKNNVGHLRELHLTALKSLSKLILSENRLTNIDTRELAPLEYLEVVDFSDNPYHCTCHIRDYLIWLNRTLATIIDVGLQHKYGCASPTELQGTHILSYHPDTAHPCPDSQPMSLQTELLILGASVVGLVILGTAITLLFYYGHLCQRIKSIQYRWQVRYREVSGVEIATDSKCSEMLT